MSSENRRNWSLTIGLLAIIAACIAAYFMTLAPEADASMLMSPVHLAQIFTINYFLL